MKFVDGRSCPTGYRYAPESIGELIPREVGVLYLVGGLYGNSCALDEIERLVEKEHAPVTLCFNGDFNWFNRDPVHFESINRRVLKSDALRGNVETELSNTADRADCGCAYPHFVDDQVVQRSNQIITKLKTVAERFPAITDSLLTLPMTARYIVGDCEVAVVHGDPESLAGWSLAREVIGTEANHLKLTRWFEQLRSDIIACTHTCLPFLHFHQSGKLVINNGSAGMSNFNQTRFGVITRIAELTIPDQHDRLYGTTTRGAHVDAMSVRFDHQRWVGEFAEQWDEDSPAYQSYWARINGSVALGDEAYTMADAVIRSAALA